MTAPDRSTGSSTVRARPANWSIALATAVTLATGRGAAAQDFDAPEWIFSNTDSFSHWWELPQYSGVQIGGGWGHSGAAVVFRALDDFVLHEVGIGFHLVTPSTYSPSVYLQSKLVRLSSSTAITPNTTVGWLNSGELLSDPSWSTTGFHPWSPSMLLRDGVYAILVTGDSQNGMGYWTYPGWPYEDPSRAGAVAVGAATYGGGWSTIWSPIGNQWWGHTAVGVRGRYRPAGDGRVVAWGCGDYSDACRIVDPLPGAIAIAASDSITAVLRGDGTVRVRDGHSWGWSFSQPYPDRVVAISMRERNLLTLLQNGQVVARREWGDLPPVPEALPPAIAIAAGVTHFAALHADGSVTCWGADDVGQSTVPKGLGPATAIAAGNNFTMALLEDGSVRCWGSNQWGECSVPADLGPVVAISAGNHHAVALLADGSVRCWGRNSSNQCTVPTDMGPAVAVAAGGSHTVALLANGTLRCWGANNTGQCDVPLEAVDVIAIAAGGGHTVALKLADVDRNGISDWDEIASGAASDCNGNMVPDAWERLARHHSVVRHPFMGGHPAAFRLQNGPTSVGDAILRVMVRGDLAAASRFVEVHLNGTLIANLFLTDGAACSEVVQERSIVVPWAQYEAARQSGEVFVRLVPSPFIGACATSSARISWEVPTFPDCDQDGVWDPCQIYANPLLDCNRNGILDSCEPPLPDCDGDGIPDACVLLANPLLDCNGNGVPDSCEITAIPARDCDGDGVLDSCQIALDPLLDCNQNGILDICEPAFLDCNGNGIADTCEILLDPSLDLNGDGIIDACSLARGDFNLDGVVNGADVGILLLLWGTSESLADLNGDGVVNGIDLGILLLNWGPVTF